MRRWWQNGVLRTGGALAATAALVVGLGALASWSVFAHEAKTGKDAAAAQHEAAAPASPWGKVCVKEKAAKGAETEHCEVVQRELALPQKRLLAMIAIRYTGKGDQAQMTLTVPLGIAVGAGIGFRMDDGRWVKLPVITCVPAGCLAGTGLNAKDIAALEGASKGWVAYTVAGGKTLSIPVELKGLDKALAGLKS